MTNPLCKRYLTKKTQKEKRKFSIKFECQGHGVEKRIEEERSTKKTKTQTKKCLRLHLHRFLLLFFIDLRKLYRTCVVSFPFCYLIERHRTNEDEGEWSSSEREQERERERERERKKRKWWSFPARWQWINALTDEKHERIKYRKIDRKWSINTGKQTCSIDWFFFFLLCSFISTCT